MNSIERQLINAEITQRREEGCDVSAISVRVSTALDSNACDSEMTNLYDELMSLPVDDSFNYTEPSTLEAIRSQRPDAQRRLDLPHDDRRFSIAFTALGWVVWLVARWVSQLRVGTKFRLISCLRKLMHCHLTTSFPLKKEQLLICGGPRPAEIYIIWIGMMTWITQYWGCSR